MPSVRILPGLRGARGATVTVPIVIDDATGLESIDCKVGYDPRVLTDPRVRLGAVTTGGMVIANTTILSRIIIAAALPEGPRAQTGTILEIDFRVQPTASVGTTRVDLRLVSLNEDGLVVSPAPRVGVDSTDGLIQIT